MHSRRKARIDDVSRVRSSSKGAELQKAESGAKDLGRALPGSVSAGAGLVVTSADPIPERTMFARGSDARRQQAPRLGTGGRTEQREE
jgi:hypothetical protein